MNKQERLLEQLASEENRSKAILDRCYDRHFCEVMDLPYGEKYLFSRIEQTLMRYEREK